LAAKIGVNAEIAGTASLQQRRNCRHRVTTTTPKLPSPRHYYNAAIAGTRHYNNAEITVTHIAK
jgi:hypothetical protein